VKEYIYEKKDRGEIIYKQPYFLLNLTRKERSGYER